MTHPTLWETVQGYAMAIVLGAGFWTWVAVETAIGLVRKAAGERTNNAA